MSVLAQCGYGRGSKIERGLSDGIIQGAIMSPRDERRDRLESAIQQWGDDYPDSLVLFDPQFYAATLNAPRDGYLREYDYYDNNNGLGRTNFSGSRIRRYIQECLDYQHEDLGEHITYLISPSVLFDDCRDYWSQVALDMAVEAADYHAQLEEPQPLLISIIVSETAFQSLEAMEEFLDALTDLDVEGFYIVVRRHSNSLQNAMEAAAFSRFMYFCYVLADINEYTVIVGYSDWHSFLLESVGVDYTACGWYQNLRQFSIARFQPSTGGGRARKRYSTTELLSSPLIIPELQDIHLAGSLTDVLSGSPYDSILAGNPVAGEPNWTDEISCLAHWFSLRSLSNRIGLHSNTPERIQETLQVLQGAHTIYRRFESQGISFDPLTGPAHINEWRDAIQGFRGIAQI